MKDCREEFFKTECVKCYGHCDRNQRLKNEYTTCYEKYLENQLQAKDKVIEESLRLLTIAKDQSCGCIDHYLTDIEDFIQEAIK